MESTKKIYTDWKEYDPESYRRRIRRENVECVNIFLIVVFGLISLLSALLGGLCCSAVGFFIPTAKAVFKKAKELDQRFIYGEDLTGSRGETWE